MPEPVEVHPRLAVLRDRWRCDDWRPMADAPRDGSPVILMSAESQGSVSYLGRWSTHYSIHGLGGCWTGADGWGTDGDLHLRGWKPAHPVALLPTVPPAELRVGDVVFPWEGRAILLLEDWAGSSNGEWRDWLAFGDRDGEHPVSFFRDWTFRVLREARP